MQRIKLSTVPGVVNAGINLSQYDVGREIAFDLYDYNGPHTVGSTDVITLRATKPSGFAFNVTASTASSNSVTFIITDTMSEESGSFPAELRIANGDDILGTANFLWNVERAPREEGAIDGDAESRNLYQELMTALNEAEELATTIDVDDFKTALLDCFAHVAWIGNDGHDYYDALQAALYPPIPATSITLNKNTLSIYTLNTTQTLTATVLPADTTDTVTWSSSDPTVASVSSSGVVTALGYGNATITATAGNVSATCAVTIAQASLVGIEATFTQGANIIYDTDSLDTLKQYLVVTATWSDSSVTTVASTDYTLSGTLTAGTSTITATYSGKSDQFTVTVTHFGYVTDGLIMWLDGEKNSTDGAHASPLTTWVDQSGNGWDWTNGSSSMAATVNAKSLSFDGSNDYLYRPYQSVPNNVAMMEIVYKRTKGGCVLTGFGRSKPGNINIHSTAGSITFHTGTGNSSDSNTGFQPGDTAGTTISVNSAGYVNGVAVETAGNGNDWQYEYPSIGKYRGSSGNDSSYCFQGEIFCIRLYNRILTEQEILANYAVDASRFNIA